MSDTEESRTTSLGRKRAAPRYPLRNRGASGKRQKIETNDDFVPLDFNDDYDENDSSDSSKESGEVSSSANTSRRGSKDSYTEEGQQEDFPPVRRASTRKSPTVEITIKKSPPKPASAPKPAKQDARMSDLRMSDQNDTSEQAAGGMQLSDLVTIQLRTHVEKMIQSRPALPVKQALQELVAAHGAFWQQARKALALEKDFVSASELDLSRLGHVLRDPDHFSSPLTYEMLDKMKGMGDLVTAAKERPMMKKPKKDGRIPRLEMALLRIATKKKAYHAKARKALVAYIDANYRPPSKTSRTGTGTAADPIAVPSDEPQAAHKDPSGNHIAAKGQGRKAYQFSDPTSAANAANAANTKSSDGEDESSSESEMEVDMDDDSSSEGSSSVGEPAASMETKPYTKNPQSSSTGGVRLLDLSPEDQADQFLYWKIKSPDALVRCISCAQPGHMQDDCPAWDCKNCNINNDHTVTQCPKTRKCTRCRKRGHDGRTCKRATVEAGLPGDECDVCSKPGHAEEECSGLWAIKNPDLDTSRKIPREEMLVGCYNCGEYGDHWGDDCPTLPGFLRNAKGKSEIWSKKYADMFVEGAGGRPVMQNGDGGGLDYDDVGTVPAYQMAMMNDWR